MDSDQPVQYKSLLEMPDTKSNDSYLRKPMSMSMPSYAENGLTQYPFADAFHHTGQQQQQETVMPSIIDSELRLPNPPARSSFASMSSFEDLGNLTQQSGPSHTSDGMPQCACGQVNCENCRRTGFVSPNRWEYVFGQNENDDFKRVDMEALATGKSMEMGDVQVVAGQNPGCIMIDPQLSHPNIGAQTWNSEPGAQTGYQQSPLSTLEIQPPHEAQSWIASPQQQSVVHPLRQASLGGFSQRIGEPYDIRPTGSQLRHHGPLDQTTPLQNQVFTQGGHTPASAASVPEFPLTVMPYHVNQLSQPAQTRHGNLSETSVQNALVQLHIRQNQLDRVETDLRRLHNLLQAGEKRIYEGYERVDRISTELEVIVGDMYKNRPRDVKQLQERMAAECDARAQQVNKAMRRINQTRREYGFPLQGEVSKRAQVASDLQRQIPEVLQRSDRVEIVSGNRRGIVELSVR